MLPLIGAAGAGLLSTSSGAPNRCPVSDVGLQFWLLELLAVRCLDDLASKSRFLAFPEMLLLCVAAMASSYVGQGL